MYGAFLGDIIGSPYEFNANNYKAKDFPLFSRRSTFTDDSVMTLAVAEAFMEAGLDADDETITKSLFRVMPEIGRRYEAGKLGAHGAIFQDCFRTIRAIIRKNANSNKRQKRPKAA